MDIRLVRVRIAQDVGLTALGNQIACLEITKGNRQAVRRYVGHIFGLNDGITHQHIRLPCGHRWLPQKRTIGGFEPANERQGRRIHHPACALPIGCTQRMDQLNQLILRIGRREPARHTGGHILQRTKRPRCIACRRIWPREKPARPVAAIAVDEGRAFRLGKLGGDFIGQPGLDIKRSVIQHRLCRRRVGI